MPLLVEEELERSLARAGLDELPAESRRWVYAKLASAGLRVGAGLSPAAVSFGKQTAPHYGGPHYGTNVYSPGYAPSYDPNPYPWGYPTSEYVDASSQIDRTIAEVQKLQALASLFGPVATPAPVAPPVTPDAAPSPREPWWRRAEHFVAHLLNVGATAIEHEEAIHEAAETLVNASRRLDPHAPPLEACPPGMVAERVSDGRGGHRVVCKPAAVGALFGPSNEAVKRYALLRADWDGFEAQGIGNYPELATDVQEWAQFRGAWEADTIPDNDLSGRLNAEIVRANRVKATLLEKATGKTVFVQDLPDRIPNIDTLSEVPISAAVDAWARQSPFVDALTNPAGPAIKLPGLPKLPGGLLGGLAIIGGSLLAADVILKQLVRKALGS